MSNVPGTLPDWNDEAHRYLLGEHPSAAILAEQLLVLQRLERSLESLVSLHLRQANALEAVAAALEERRQP